MDNLSKSDVQKIVKDEINNFVSKQLENEISKELKRGKARQDVNELIKNALTELYKYMWVRRTIWQNDIK